MPATFTWCEDNGGATGSPAHGTIQFQGATDVNWKNVDNCTANSGTPFTSAPITAGNNSYLKYQYGYFSGSFTEILNCVWSANTGSALATGLTLVGTVTSTYTTPSTTALSGSPTNFTAGVAIGSGLTVLFSTVGPQGSSPASTLSATGYTQYLVSQLQTTTSAAAGNTASVTTELQYSEN